MGRADFRILCTNRIGTTSKKIYPWAMFTCLISHLGYMSSTKQIETSITPAYTLIRIILSNVEHLVTKNTVLTR